MCGEDMYTDRLKDPTLENSLKYMYKETLTIWTNAEGN
jgi:hypothetical protein